MAPLAGLPLVEHVRRRTLASGVAFRVVVATDDERIRASLLPFGAEVVMTGLLASGTHRVAAAAAGCGARIVLNVQGDMPLVDPAHLRAVVAAVDAGADIATVAVPLDGDPTDPDVVKVAIGADGDALYFSRLPVPRGGPWWRHVGLYAFRAEVLADVAARAPSALAQAEDLEQLTWLEHGRRIAVHRGTEAALSVDTQAHLDAVRRSVEDRTHPGPAPGTLSDRG